MRERISPAANYAKSVALGEVLRAAVFHTSVDTPFYSAGHRDIFEPIFLSVWLYHDIADLTRGERGCSIAPM